MRITPISFRAKITNLSDYKASKQQHPPMTTSVCPRDSIHLSEAAKKHQLSALTDQINDLFKELKGPDQYEETRKRFLDILCADKTEKKIVETHKSSNRNEVTKFFGASLKLSSHLQRIEKEDDCSDAIDALLEDCHISCPGTFDPNYYYEANSLINLEDIAAKIEIGMIPTSIFTASPDAVDYMNITLDLQEAEIEGLIDDGGSQNDLCIIVPTHCEDLDQKSIIDAFKLVMQKYEQLKKARKAAKATK